MSNEDGILVGVGGTTRVFLLPRYANRHGLIAGATGTGKTITLQMLAENFSNRGVPVFVADVKGDLSGIAEAGSANPKVEERIKKFKLTDFQYEGNFAVFWDLAGERGHPIRATITDLGPLLLSRLLDLNATQEGVLNVAFQVADDEGLLLLDLKDLRSMLQYLADNAAKFTTSYGNVTAASVGTILRQLLILEQQGGEKFFGEPALQLEDMIRTIDGCGQINVLAADQLIHSPRLYSTFLLWMLSELFETLPEAGDLDKPKFVFFFDEAHLLFDEAPKVLLDKIEQVVRLIRSKGVGIYFITQNPLDLPESVLGQLGNRVQHALRAFTPKDQKAVRTAADTFRTNPKLNTAEVITELGIGEALVSMLEENAMPGMVQRVSICPPRSRIGPVTPAERLAAMKTSPVAGHYEQLIDRESAYEILKQRAEAEVTAAKLPENNGRRRGKTVTEEIVTDLAKSVGKQLGRQLIRGVLGSLFKGR